MANISRYTYQSLITTNGTEPYIYKNADNTIYSAFAMSDGENNWLDLFYSTNDGDSWTLDSDLPIHESVTLHNPRIIQCGDILYLLAWGKNATSNKDTVHIIRKYFNVEDEQGNIVDPFWDADGWTEIIYDTQQHCRLTDVQADSEGFYLFLAYDKGTIYGTYETRLCIFSLSDFEVKIDISMSGTSTINNHGGKLVMLSDTTVGMTWQKQNENVYNNKHYRILYRQYDFLQRALSYILWVSDDENYNNYHPSITKDSANNVYISWLNTRDTNVDGSVKYYVDNKIYVATIQDVELAGTVIVSENADKNEYPYLVCDEYDNLYILYNGKEKVNYLTRKVGTLKWTPIKNVKDADYKILVGFCYDGNLYTIIQQDNIDYMLRIDTLLAENFAPVSDFQIVNIDANTVYFAWTAARNAEDIQLQGMNSDLSTWDWKKPNTTSPITVGTDTAYCVQLEANTIYAFKLVYKTKDKKEHTIFYPRRYISQKDHDENYQFSWTIPKDTIEQTLYVAKEVWSDVADVPNTADTFSYNYGENATVFRLNITGGMADGLSNEVSPLIIELNEDENYKLNWSAFKTADYIELQQSIDRIHYYPVKNININPQAEQYVVDKLNTVTYSYRLVYGNIDSGYNYTNVVSLTNNLKVISTDWNYVKVQWNNIEENEVVRFQYSSNEGNTWVNKSFPMKDGVATVNALSPNTDYWLRLYYPNRFTGKYSNIVKFKTEKRPVEDFKITEVEGTNVELEFVTSNLCYDFDILLEDSVTGEKTKYNCMSSEMIYVSSAYTATKDQYSVLLKGLKKGTTYFIQVACRECDWEYSTIEEIQTTGDNPQGFKLDSVDKHTAKFKWNTLERITDSNISGRVFVEYSVDKAVWEIESLKSTAQPFKLEGLRQNTIYYARLRCDYGNNKGTSNVISFKTQTDKFNPVFGHRNHNELCFCVKDNLAYIFDQGKLYKYNLSTNDQELMIDYGISANHVYGDVKTDKNGCVHVVFSYGKGIYYATNCKTKSGNKNLNNVITIEQNPVVNEYIYPNMEIDQKNNMVYIVWQENYGYYSNVSIMQYKNSEPMLDESATLLNTGLHNNLPLVRLDGQGGFVVSAVDSAYRLQMMFAEVDNDYNSYTYQEVGFDLKTLELVNPYKEAFLNYDFWIDNLGRVRIFYDSTDGTNKTSTYTVYEDGKFEDQCVFNENMTDTSVFALKDFVIIARNNQQIYSSKYLQERQTFSDIKLEDVTTNIEIPLTVYCTKDKVYILGFEQGLFKIKTLNVADIVQSDNYVDDIWIDNTFQIDNDDLEVNVKIWTSGNPNEYPELFMKVNNRIEEITPLDDLGERQYAQIKVSNFEDVTADGELMKVKITFNTNKTIVKDITDMLCYVWDENKEIVNKDEN